MPCFYLTPNKTTSTKFLNSKSALPKPCTTDDGRALICRLALLGFLLFM